jgi:hypothetical protein
LPIVWWETSITMEQQNLPPATPQDATKATEGQRTLQDQLNRKNEDPNAPGGHQDHHQLADET